MKKKPIVINVKRFLGQFWLNEFMFDGKLCLIDDRSFKTKKEALEAYPKLVDKKNRKITKVWLVEAL